MFTQLDILLYCRLQYYFTAHISLFPNNPFDFRLFFLTLYETVAQSRN